MSVISRSSLTAAPLAISFGGGAATYTFSSVDTGNGTGAAVATGFNGQVSSFLGGVSDFSAGAAIDGSGLNEFSAFPSAGVIPNSAADDFIGLSFALPDGVHYGYAEVNGPTLVSYSYNATAGATSTTGMVEAGPQPGLVVFTDTTTQQSAQEQAQAYSGPVNYLQSQFIWSRSDAVAVASSAPNVFLHGGPGDDALAVTGGRNVLDGGAGSNFLVGGTGADGGTDTFFVDGRGSAVTWSSLSNFHKGDALTLFGFANGKSTLPVFTTDGATGYQGATLHSELNGAGTGVNNSVTFVGISLGDAASKFTYTFGSAGNVSYVNIAFTG